MRSAHPRIAPTSGRHERAQHDGIDFVVQYREIAPLGRQEGSGVRHVPGRDDSSRPRLTQAIGVTDVPGNETTTGLHTSRPYVLISLFVAVAAGAAPPSKSDRRCILKSAAGIRQVAAAARADVRRCLEHSTQPLSACLAGAPKGRLAKVAKAVARREGTSCARPPALGFAPGAAATAAIDAERRSAVAVLPDAVAGDACRRSLLRAAGRCTDRFLAEYVACAARALPTATDDGALVRCKGADPRGRIARACDDQLGRITCAATADALFPGCAGSPLAACLAGHAKAAASRALNDGTGLCPVAPPPPAPEPIDLAVVPLPADVESAQFPWWNADGSRIVFAVSLAGVPRMQIASIAPDGSDFRCLTCPIATAPGPILTKPIPFSDGTRVMVRVGNQTPVSPADHAVLECAPSVLDCQTPTLVPIEPPSGTDPNVMQDQREFRPAPDSEHVGFTQVREASDGEATTTAILGRLVRAADRYVVEDPRVVSTLGELKQFTPDQQAVIVAAFSQSPFGAANPDDMRVDLVDGAVTRVTSHPDYDEPVEFSPDGGWFLVGSGRGGAFFSVFSQVPRPGLVNPGLEILTAFLFLTQRENLLEPWLVDRFGERGDYVGQRLNPDSPAQGWDGRVIMNWHPDGTRIVFWEAATTAAAVPDTRLVVATLSSRTPSTSPIVPAPLPSLAAWAPPLAGYVPPAIAPASRAGLVSGTAQVAYTAGTPHRLVVTYTDFSDDGRAIVDGSETAVYTPGLTGETTYDAAVSLRGCRQGVLRATSAHVALSGITGRVESEVDGRHLVAGD